MCCAPTVSTKRYKSHPTVTHAHKYSPAWHAGRSSTPWCYTTMLQACRPGQVTWQVWQTPHTHVPPS